MVAALSHGARGQPSPPGSVDGSRGMRLADVVAVAVRQSPDLARARIDLTAARAVLLQAEGSEDVRVGAQATTNVSRGGRADPQGNVDQEHVEVSASKGLSTGGTLSVTVGGDRLKSVTNAPDQNGVIMPAVPYLRYSTTAQVGLNQPLLRGAGAGAFEAPIHEALRRRDAAALAHEASARDLLVSVSQAYWQVAFAWRQLEVRKASLDLAQKQLDYTEGLIRVEKVARSEALAVQQVIAVRKQDVIAGEQELYERSIALRQLAGLEIGPDALALATEALPQKVDAAPVEMAAVVRAAFAHSAQLAALEAQRHAAELAVAAAASAARSRLDLAVTAGVLGADATAHKAFSNLFSDTGYAVIGGLTFDHAIEGRTERGGQEVARAALLAAEVAERDARARLAVRATRAVQRAEAALASITLGDEAIDLASQNVTAEQKRFELGKSTNFDVLRRQDELEQARLRQATAVTDYLSARADLDGLAGAILARYGIVVP
ncbi:MAG TPA: TolC family protein [Kofleriaceae bacterium]